MKIVINGWLYSHKYSWEKEPSFTFFSGEKLAAVVATEHGTGYQPVMPHSFELDVPADWNGVGQQVAALKAERIAAYTTVAAINARLSALQALPNAPHTGLVSDEAA